MGTFLVDENRMFNPKFIAAELQAALHHVHHDDPDVAKAEEFQSRQTDGARSDDEDGFSCLRIGPDHGVIPDSKGLDQGELVVGKIVAGVEFAGRTDPGRAQASVGVNAKNLNAGAAVAVAFPAGRGGGVIDVGFEGASISNLKVVDTLTHGYNFQAQLMSGNPGIGEEGHLAQIAGKVGSADTHTVSADQCLSRARSRRVGEIDHRDDLWLGEFNCFHGI